MKKILALLLIFLTATIAKAQVPSAEDQIHAAVAATPEAYRSEATVLGYEDANAPLTVLREEEGRFICLADNPADDRFHTACYHRSLEPFMKRGRELRREGKKRNEINRIRQEEIDSGELSIPDHPAALYTLSGPADSYNTATGEISGANSLHVIYVPYATAASTGLPTKAPRGEPWLMAEGKPWAHIMIVPQQKEAK